MAAAGPASGAILEADTYTISGDNIAHGLEQILLTKYNGSGSTRMRATFLRFDLTTSPTADGSSLRLSLVPGITNDYRPIGSTFTLWGLEGVGANSSIENFNESTFTYQDASSLFDGGGNGVVESALDGFRLVGTLDESGVTFSGADINGITLDSYLNAIDDGDVTFMVTRNSANDGNGTTFVSKDSLDYP